MNIQFQPNQEQQQRLLTNEHINRNNPYQQQIKNEYPDLNEQQHQLIHRIQYGDTLQGLSLQYDVSILKIKQRNAIETDSIYYLKQIIIPNPRYDYSKQQQTQQMKILHFMEFMTQNEKSEKTAKFYLMEAEWIVEDAVQSYKNDLQWERANKIKIESTPIKFGDIKQQQKNYQLIELKEKKKI